MNHTHFCPYCEREFKCEDPECQDGREQECEDCRRDGERDLSASSEDYANWI
jgi:hypothetical protein